MNQLARGHASPYSKLSSAILAVLVGLAAGLAREASARAADVDPFAGDSPPAAADAEGLPSKSKVPPAPAASPAEPAVASVPGAVEQLPASAYPEPFTRGLYGGPLWLDMQGLQWPYMPRSGIGISGYGWIDGNFRLIRSGNPNISPKYTELLDQGRALLRVTPTYTDGHWFVQVQAELVANTNQFDVQPAPSVVSADDVWVRTGVLQLWDVTVGRFQGFDVYPLGMGLDLNTYERQGAFDPSFTGSPNGYTSVPALYPAEYLFYRPAGSRVANAALHVYPSRSIRGELLTQFGSDGSENYLGARPAAIFDIGILKLRGALEYQYKWAEDPAATAKNTIRNRGGAASAQVVLAPMVEAGLNFGYAVVDVADARSGGGPNLGASGNRFSVGGFVDVSPAPRVLPNLLLGAGGNYATFHNLLQDQDGKYESSTNLQVFIAAQYLFYKQLYVKIVGGYAKSHFENQATTMPYNDDMFSVRLRLMYLF
jgi:hypothetical protein